MLRSQRRTHPSDPSQSVVRSRSQGLLVFSVGGQRLAARTEDIEGVHPWHEAVPVPSDTPFINAMVRFEKACMPVFDLAAKLKRPVNPVGALCLMIKHQDGPMAVCIDAIVPSLHSVDPSTIRPSDVHDPETLGLYATGDERVRIVDFPKLGLPNSSRRQ